MKIKKILFGLFWVVIFLALFTFFGGGRIIKWAGEGIMDLGNRIINYEEQMKDVAKDFLKGVEEKGKKIKEIKEKVTD